MVRTSQRNPRSGLIVNVITGPVHPANTTKYISDGMNAWASVETSIQFRMPFNCVVRNFYARILAAAGAGESYVFTVRRNGANTPITCTIAGAADVECNDLVNEQAYDQGDLFSICIVASLNAVGRQYVVSLGVFDN